MDLSVEEQRLLVRIELLAQEAGELGTECAGLGGAHQLGTNCCN